MIHLRHKQWKKFTLPTSLEAARRAWWALFFLIANVVLPCTSNQPLLILQLDINQLVYIFSI